MTNYLNITWHKGIAELRAEAARGYLGVLWWVVEPLLYMGAFVLVFTVGLPQEGEAYAGFLLCGLIPWKFFSSTVQTASSCVPQNRGLISQIYFPKYVLVGSIVVANTAKFLAIALLLILLLAIAGWLSPEQIMWLPAVMVAELLLTAGVSCFAAIIVPLIPDTRLIIDNLLLLTFFMSGIFFRIEPAADGGTNLLYLNPIADLVHCFRSALTNDAAFRPDFLLYVALWGVVMLALGLVCLRYFDRRFAKLPL